MVFNTHNQVGYTRSDIGRTKSERFMSHQVVGYKVSSWILYVMTWDIYRTTFGEQSSLMKAKTTLYILLLDAT
jgi:hypothetical protein